MTFLQSWLSKPRATVRIDTAVPWAAWTKLLRRPFMGRQDDMRTRIEVIDRLSLGGKKSLPPLISIEGRRLLVGVGEEATAPILHLREGSWPLLVASARPRATEGRRAPEGWCAECAFILR